MELNYDENVDHNLIKLSVILCTLNKCKQIGIWNRAETEYIHKLIRAKWFDCKCVACLHAACRGSCQSRLTPAQLRMANMQRRPSVLLLFIITERSSSHVNLEMQQEDGKWKKVKYSCWKIVEKSWLSFSFWSTLPAVRCLSFWQMPNKMIAVKKLCCFPLCLLASPCQLIAMPMCVYVYVCLHSNNGVYVSLNVDSHEVNYA